MKKIITLVSVVFLSLLVFAQNPMMGRRAGGQMPTGHFYGKVVDPSNKAVEAASVTLVTSRMDTATKKAKDVVVGGMLTDKKGNFSIENVPVFGRYKLKITGIGFKPYDKPVAFDMPNRDAIANAGTDPSALLGAVDKDLGNIKLDVDEKVLNTVTVTASRPTLTLGIDRKIFNVDKNITSAGGTAVDVMKNVPSVNVDIDGNVTMRNSSPTIFVDGRPTTLTLDQIPADAIESVEIITNPSAKYDASGGTAGILNIVMKKNRRVGYSGNLRANADSRARFGGGGDLNIRQGKINVFAGGQYMERKMIATGITDRTTFGRLDTTYHSIQNDRTVNENHFGFVRFGIDYFMDIRNTLSVTGNFVNGNRESDGTSNIGIDTMKGGAKQRSEYQRRLTNTDGNFHNQGGQISYKHNFPQNGHEITADVTYNKSRNDNNSIIGTDYYDSPESYAFIRPHYNQYQIGKGSSENLTLQTDYSNPISQNAKVELGARAQMRKINSENDITIAGRLNSTLYNSQDNVYAAYATFTNRINKFGYQAGLRVESSNYQGTLPTKAQTFKTDFPVSLFPSLFLSEKLGNGDDELQLNYSRRINRPFFMQLFPFTDYSDSLNISRGNPALKPEFTNSLELSYSKIFKNRDNFIASVYFKNTNDLITRIQSFEFDTLLKRNIPINTYQNANRSYTTGLELTSRNKITKFWDLTTNANFFTAKIKLDSLPSPDQFVSYLFKLNNTFRLPMNFSLQISGDYQSKTIVPPGGRGIGGEGGGGRMFGGGGGGFFGGQQSAAQGFIRANYGVDAAIRYEFLKNKAASLSLNVNDIFRTRKFDQHTQTAFFIQDAQRRVDPQVFRLNFNYRFGKFDVSLFKRKNTKAENNIDTGNQNF